MRETERSTARLVREAPSLDLVFDLLADRQRRYALYYLSEARDGVATVDDLVEHVSRLEDGPGEPGRASVRAALEHVHLPKLADAGVIEHDARSGTVRYWRQPSIEEWLEHARYKERS
ncbi:DUF7344 domain-containing protein [Saliphagus infecundisoli]|uniref:DUF7344 domain-containing protein n=1 Tax=Saliphagus infecundisoli TaxID=1849069 RepID=A0ABD5QF68_9EURY|nr:hypothetical protein [Saliphagus infecundisoli]